VPSAPTARRTILVVPSFRDRILVIVDEVTTVCRPGELIDVLATERRISLNVRLKDLIDTRQASEIAEMLPGRSQERSGADLPKQAPLRTAVARSLS